jgi:L-alanine-DL-glutamate epimerase-like enolase superfamily enzyme
MGQEPIRISTVEAIPIAFDYSHDGPLTGFGGSDWSKLGCLLVRVETEDGLVGWGEAFGYSIIPATVAVIEKVLAPLAAGLDACNLEGTMEHLKKTLHIFGRGGPTQYALGGLDIALWDLAGKRAGCSVAQLLGGRRRDRIPAYTSLMKLKEAKVIHGSCEKAVSRGFRAIKLHETTVEAVAAAREAIGPGIDLMLDVNCAWTPHDALDMARQMRRHELKWLEEPIWPPEDVDSLRRLKREGGVPLAAGENLINSWAFKPFADGETLDYLQPSVTKVGGIGDVVKVAAMAELNGCQVAPHSPYFGPGLLATLQLAAAFPLIETIESFGVRLEQKLFGGVGLPESDGTIAIPTAAGLGADPDLELVERLRLDRD